jgi:tetratricopeptide (TPR) repeat protein
LLGDSYGTRGDFESALATYTRALQVLDGMGGEHEKTGAILNNMAIVFENQGKLDKSEELYRKAKLHFEQAGDKANVLTTLVNLADNNYLRGNLAEAQKLYQQTIQAAAKMDPNMPGYALYRSADLALTQGRVRDAQNMAEEAIKSISEEQGNYQGLTSAMSVLGSVLEAEGNLDGARDEFEKTLAIQKKAGMLDLADETQEELAELDLLQGHAKKAEPVLRKVIADFEKQHSDPDSTSAYTLLSRALLAQGKVDEAAKAIQRAVELNANGPDPALTLPVNIQRARVNAAAGVRGGTNLLAQARQDLRSTVSTAKKLGYYGLAGEARVALARLDLKSTPTPTRAEMTSLILDARNRGFELLAHEAEQVLNRQQTNEVASNSPAR